MSKALASAVLLVLMAVGLSQIANVGLQNRQFQDYKNTFGKKYAKQIDSDYRLSIFNKNKAKIDAHNNNPKKTHTQEINQFSDLSDAQFAAIYLNLIVPPAIKTSLAIEPLMTVSAAVSATVSANSSVDWTTNGKVTAVKNQGGCGSCWAFSAAAAVESAYLVSKNLSLDLSEQQLVDCSTANYGCGGGAMGTAMEYIKVSGLNLESAYPYKAVRASCRLPSGPYKISSHARVWACTGIMTAIFRQPMTVAVDATNWSAYKSGIFSNCATSHNHGVVLVGYASTHWKVKNSWGKTWGEAGFIRLALGNTCGICLLATMPSL